MRAACFQHVQFKDRQREKQRQSTLRARAAASDAAEPSGRKKVSQKPQAPAVPKKLTAVKRRLLEVRQDADDMSNDYALFRKLKRGKLTEVRDCAHRHYHTMLRAEPACSVTWACCAQALLSALWLADCIGGDMSSMCGGLQETYDALTGLAEHASSERQSPMEGTVQQAAGVAAGATQGPPNGGRWRPQRHKLKRATKHKLKKQA